MKKRLGDYIHEYSVRNKLDEDIPVYSVTNSQGFCRDYFSKDVASKDRTTYKIVSKGCFAYNPSRINVGSVDWQRNEERVIVSPLYNVFSVSSELDQQYLYYYLKSTATLYRIKEVATGSVRDNLRLSMLYDFMIELPDFAEQREIVKKLDLLSGLIQLRRSQLSALDNLIKARFVEMFGKIKADFVPVESLCEIVTDGTHQPPKFVSEGIPFLFVSNIANNVLTYDTEKYITEKTYQELIKRTPIEVGDILLSTVGSYGHPAIVTSDRPFCFQRHIAYLKPKKERVNSIYLWSAFLSDDGQRQIEERVKGIAQKTLNLTEIRKISIRLPPLSLQNDFAAFVEQVDKSRLLCAPASDFKAEYGNFMSKYFV